MKKIKQENELKKVLFDLFYYGLVIKGIIYEGADLSEKDKEIINRKIIKKEKLIKELFKMIYNWGRTNIVVNENSLTFQKLLSKILKIN